MVSFMGCFALYVNKRLFSAWKKSGSRLVSFFATLGLETRNGRSIIPRNIKPDIVFCHHDGPFLSGEILHDMDWTRALTFFKFHFQCSVKAFILSCDAVFNPWNRSFSVGNGPFLQFPSSLSSVFFSRSGKFHPNPTHPTQNDHPFRSFY